MDVQPNRHSYDYVFIHIFRGLLYDRQQRLCSFLGNSGDIRNHWIGPPGGPVSLKVYRICSSHVMASEIFAPGGTIDTRGQRSHDVDSHLPRVC
jgi:hypothetical protein